VRENALAKRLVIKTVGLRNGNRNLDIITVKGDVSYRRITKNPIVIRRA